MLIGFDEVYAIINACPCAPWKPISFTFSRAQFHWEITRILLHLLIARYIFLLILLRAESVSLKFLKPIVHGSMMQWCVVWCQPRLKFKTLTSLANEVMHWYQLLLWKTELCVVLPFCILICVWIYVDMEHEILIDLGENTGRLINMREK